MVTLFCFTYLFPLLRDPFSPFPILFTRKVPIQESAPDSLPTGKADQIIFWVQCKVK